MSDSRFLVVELHNGVLYPVTMLGAYAVKEKAIGEALKLGYRGIDTAWCYNTEEACGRQVREFDNKPIRKTGGNGPIPCGNFRVCEEKEFLGNFAVPHGPLKDNRRVFVTTKVWCQMLTPEGADETVANHQKLMEREAIDLLLLHWPGDWKNHTTVGNPENRVVMWRKLEELYAQGKVRAIGVSNYMVKHLEPLIENILERQRQGDQNAVIPMINQIEMSPYCPPPADLMELQKNHKIEAIAYAPLFAGKAPKLVEEPAISEVAKAKGVECGTVALRWALQKGFTVIPKSDHTERLRSNLLCEAISLSPDEMDKIDSISFRGRSCPDPYPIP